jgi:fumarate reductase flavoprotein subunit
MIEKNVDICVVGGAGAGLSAAVKAMESGAKKVIVLEKMKSPGGCTKMAAGMFGIDTPVQKRFGFYYNVDDCFRELITALNWEVDALLVRKWILGSGENIRWLEALGVEFDAVVPFNGLPDRVRSTYHMSRKSGYKTGLMIVRALLAACERMGIEIVTEARVKKLLKGEDGAVRGVEADLPGGEKLTVNADAVVLATGSISSNKELIRRFYQSEAYNDIRIMANVPHNTGDGLIMAEDIGAGAGTVSTLFIGPHNHFPGASEITGTLVRRPHPLRLSRNGDRVSDESFCVTSEFGWMIGVNVDKQPGKVIYGIVDQALIDHMRRHERAPMTVVEELTTYHGNTEHSLTGEGAGAVLKEGEWLDRIEEESRKEQEAGRAIIADTLDEVAEWIGADPGTLKSTIDRYNTYCRLSYDAEFLKDPKFMFPVSTPPFYAYRGLSGIDTCIGGLLIDHGQRVLDKEHFAIPGLYAAGVLTSGWAAHNYAFFGSEMSYTVYSGRTAGVNALQYVNG